LRFILAIGVLCACLFFVSNLASPKTGTPQPTRTPRLTSTPGPTRTPRPTETIAAPVVYKVGDVIPVGQTTITLESYTFEADTINAIFVIENKSAQEINISSILYFDARNGDGTNLNMDLFCDGGSFDGVVLPNDRLRGNICWQGITALPVKIYFKSNRIDFGMDTLVWTIEQ